MRISRIIHGAALAAALVGFSHGANAQNLTAKEIMTQFNAVISNDFSSNHDVEGRLAAKNISKGATFYNHPSNTPSDFKAINAETITGCISNYCNVNGGGGVNYQTSDGSHNPGTWKFNLNGGGSVSQGSPTFSIAALTAPLDALQDSLASMVVNNLVTKNGGGDLTFNLTSDSTKIAVFSVTTDFLSTARNIFFSSNFASYETIIVNVTGAVFAQDGGSNFNPIISGGYNLANHIIWNFVDAVDLTFKQWEGAVLAGNGTVKNTSPIEGFLYAKNLIADGELHDKPFLGDLPRKDVPVPGPIAGAGLLPLLLAGAFFMMRRRTA